MLKSFIINGLDILALKNATTQINGLAPVGVKVSTKQINKETKIDSFYLENREIKIEGKIYYNVEQFLSQIYSLFIPGETLKAEIIKMNDEIVYTTDVFVEEVEVDRYKFPVTYKITLLSDHYLTGEKIVLENNSPDYASRYLDVNVTQGFRLVHEILAGEPEFSFVLNDITYKIVYGFETKVNDVLVIDTTEETVYYNDMNIFHLFESITEEGLPKLKKGRNTMIINPCTTLYTDIKVLGV